MLETFETVAQKREKKLSLFSISLIDITIIGIYFLGPIEMQSSLEQLFVSFCLTYSENYINISCWCTFFIHATAIRSRLLFTLNCDCILEPEMECLQKISCNFRFLLSIAVYNLIRRFENYVHSFQPYWYGTICVCVRARLHFRFTLFDSLPNL